MLSPSEGSQKVRIKSWMGCGLDRYKYLFSAVKVNVQVSVDVIFICCNKG